MGGLCRPAVVTVAGGVGLVVGRALFASQVESFWSVWASYFWLTLGVSLVFLGSAVWSLRRSGAAPLVAVGLFAVVVLLFTLNDFFDGDVFWSRDYEADRLVGSWLVVVSTVVVLIGVLWSAAEQLAGGRTEAWWRRGWGVTAIGVVGLAIIGSVGFVLFGDERDAVPATGLEGEDGDEDVADVPDAWSIAADGDANGAYIFTMIRTFGPMGLADVEALGGRLVWSQSEVDLCDVGIFSGTDESVQIGIISPTTEGCPGMLESLIEFGVPDTACLFVQSDGIVDEHCAPLLVTSPES